MIQGLVNPPLPKSTLKVAASKPSTSSSLSKLPSHSQVPARMVISNVQTTGSPVLMSVLEVSVTVIVQFSSGGDVDAGTVKIPVFGFIVP